MLEGGWTARHFSGRESSGAMRAVEFTRAGTTGKKQSAGAGHWRVVATDRTETLIREEKPKKNNNSDKNNYI